MTIVVLWISSPHVPQNNCLLSLRQFQTFSWTPSRLSVAHQPLSGCVHAAKPSPLPGIWPLECWPQQVSRQSSQAGECWSSPILCAGISLLCSLHPCCCALLHDSEASSLPTSHLHQWRVFPVCWNFSSFTAPSQRCRSHPYSFFSVLFCFFFCPTPGMWGYSCLLGSLLSSASVQ